MATSGTYNYAPSLGELTLYSFQLCGVRPTEILQEHMQSARMATNLLLANWANRGVNLWTVDTETVPLLTSQTVSSSVANGSVVTLTFGTVNTPVYTVGSSITYTDNTNSNLNGTFQVTASGVGYVSYALSYSGAGSGGTITTSTPAATYSVDPTTVMILDAYITIGSLGSTQEIDRIILPISRTEYASYPNKQNPGFPTTYWFDRLISPTVTLWPVPDGNQSYLKYYRCRQMQDANFTNGQNVEIPYLWLDAFAFGLANRLAQIWAPQTVQILKPQADEAYQIAADQNTEYAQMYISPQIAGYFR